MGYAHFSKVSGETAVAVGVKGSEVDIADSSGNLAQAGTTITATGAELNILDGVTATAAEINGAADVSAQESMNPAAGFLGSGTIYESSTIKQGSIFRTSIIIDMTDTLVDSGDTMIIGVSGASNIGQNLTLNSGTILGGTMTCLEVPAGASDDVDLYSATVGTGAVSTDVTSLTETALVTKGGAWTAGSVSPLSAFPADTAYLYLCTGSDDDGTYTAGRFLIEFWGV